jgi:hypothetical protein
MPSPVGESHSGPTDVIIRSLRARSPRWGLEDVYSTADFHEPAVPDGIRSPEPEMVGPSLAEEHRADAEQGQERLAGYAVVPPAGRSPHEGGS